MLYWTLLKTFENCRHIFQIKVLYYCWYTNYALLFHNLPLSNLWSIQVWGLTYSTYLKPVTALQNRVARIMTFSEPLLKSLRLLKFSDIIHFNYFFVYQWYHKLYNHRMIICLLNQLMHVPLNTPFCYTGTNLWNSLSIDVKKIKPFSSFLQNIKNSVIDGYKSVINSWSFMIILSLTTMWSLK